MSSLSTSTAAPSATPLIRPSSLVIANDVIPTTAPTTPANQQHQHQQNAAADAILSRYNYIGFDLDHTLARYRLDVFLPFLFNMLRAHIVEHGGFPASMLEWPFDHNLLHKALVFDAQLGHSLKLSESLRVVAASHGFPQRMLTPEEISAAYPHSLSKDGFDGARHPRYHPLYTYFEMPAQILVSMMVQCVDDGTVKKSTGAAPATFTTPSFATDAHNPASAAPHSKYAAIFSTLGAAFEYHLGSSTRGDYFPAFNADPSKFLFPRYEVAAWLKQLRAKGVFTFLVTNSRLDYTILLCEYSFGPAWTECFDIIVADARKPSWFIPDGVQYSSTTGGVTSLLTHSIRPFYRPAADLTADKTRPVGTVDSLLSEKHAIWVHGNAETMQSAFEENERRKALLANGGDEDLPYSEPRVIYFGDHLETDCRSTRLYTSWSSAGVVEEIEPLHADGKKKLSTFAELHLSQTISAANSTNDSNNWGSFFHHHTFAHSADATSSPLPTVASNVTSSSSSTAPTSGSISQLTHWHSLLRKNCEIVVGCLTEFLTSSNDTLAVPVDPSAAVASSPSSSPAASSSVSPSSSYPSSPNVSTRDLTINVDFTCNDIPGMPTHHRLTLIRMNDSSNIKLTTSVRLLLREYLSSLGIDVSFQNVDKEVNELPGRKYTTEGNGALFVLMLDKRDVDADVDVDANADADTTATDATATTATTTSSSSSFTTSSSPTTTTTTTNITTTSELIGCIALQDLGFGISEAKRLYVKPIYRGFDLGRLLLVHIIDVARQAGYDTIRLDTLERFKSANQLYSRLGFQRIAPYNYNPEHDILYFELTGLKGEEYAKGKEDVFSKKLRKKAEARS